VGSRQGRAGVFLAVVCFAYDDAHRFPFVVGSHHLRRLRRIRHGGGDWFSQTRCAHYASDILRRHVSAASMAGHLDIGSSSFSDPCADDVVGCRHR
jgi:hypothetical protein